MDSKKDTQTFLNIPESILRDKDLNTKKIKGFTIKAVWAYIDWLDKLAPKPGCWSSNKTAAEFLGISECSFSNCASKLQDLKKIHRKGDTNNRVFFSNLTSNHSLNDSKSEDRSLKDSKSEENVKTIRSSPRDSESLIETPGSSYKDLETSLNDSNHILNKTISIPKEDHSKKNLSSDTISDASSTSKSNSKLYAKDSISYVLSEYLLELILKRWSNYDKIRLQKETYREKKLQSGARSIDLMIRIDKRPVDELTAVIEWAQNDKFWWQNILSADKLRKQYDRLLMAMEKVGTSTPKQDELPHDPDPELTELVIETYRKVYRPRGEFPSPAALKHFRLVSTKAKKNYKLDSSSSKKTFVEEFFQIAHDTWSSKGEEVMPWDLSGTMMWDYKIPQYYQNMGVPEALIGEVNGG